MVKLKKSGSSTSVPVVPPETKPINVERGFITKMLETKDMKLLKEKNIKSSFFTGDNKRVFNYILKTFRTTGEVPTFRVVLQKFPSYGFETHLVDGCQTLGTDEPLLYWCIELRNKSKHNKMADIVEEVAGILEKGDTEKAYSSLKKGVWYIEGNIVESKGVDITKDTEDRKSVYLERKKNKGMMGIPTGISHLDYMLKGLVNGTLTTLIAKTGVGKAVTLDTPVLTPTGFIPMKDIKEGSVVFDEKGNTCKVLKVFPQGKKQIYRVHFEDGSYTDCCKDHLWKFKTIDDIVRGNSWRVESTEYLLQKPLTRGNAYNLCIPVAKAINHPYKELPLDPYILGCLLGDGGFTTDRISFTNPEKDLLDKLNKKLRNKGYFVHHKGTNCQYYFKSNTSGFNWLYRTIKKLGLAGKSSCNKFIPGSYMYVSVKQRLQLLQGLIDTDGHVDAKGHTSFSTISFKLANDVMQLVRSLGFRCSLGKYDRQGRNNTEYIVRIWSDSGIFFTSEKHKKRYELRKIPKRKNYYDILKIVGIEVLNEYQEMQCITVDSPYSTFICGDYIVTHNTWFLILVACHAMLQGYKVVIFVREMSTEIMQDRCEAMLFGMLCGSFDYNKFKSGTLDKDQETAYFDFLDNILPALEPMRIEDVSGVSSVMSVIEQEKPDVIYIDGAYLMEDEQGAKDDWLRVTHITRDLKQIAKNSKIPVFINTQADQNTTSKAGPGLGDIKYAQSIGQDSDNIMALYRDDVMLNDDEMGIRMLKQREGLLGKAVINWDFKNMDFKSIYSEAENGNSLDDDAGDEEQDGVFSV